VSSSVEAKRWTSIAELLYLRNSVSAASEQKKFENLEKKERARHEGAGSRPETRVIPGNLTCAPRNKTVPRQPVLACKHNVKMSIMDEPEGRRYSKPTNDAGLTEARAVKH
jgi:hypothetical protein